MTIIIWKIIIVSIILLETIIGAFLGWRVLRLMNRNKLMQADRNTSLEALSESREENAKLSNSLREKGIEIDKIKKEKPMLISLEKKMILASLNMSQYKAAIQDSKTKSEARKTYTSLKKKIKESIN